MALVERIEILSLHARAPPPQHDPPPYVELLLRTPVATLDVLYQDRPRCYAITVQITPPDEQVDGETLDSKIRPFFQHFINEVDRMLEHVAHRRRFAPRVTYQGAHNPFKPHGNWTPVERQGIRFRTIGRRVLKKDDSRVSWQHLAATADVLREIVEFYVESRDWQSLPQRRAPIKEQLADSGTNYQHPRAEYALTM